MNAVNRDRIGAAFAAARDYDGNARVQRRVAEDLATRIAALPLPPRPRVLEIGCGTGFLTQALMDRGLVGNWLITDLSPAMVERCRERVGEGEGRQFAVLDGEYDVPADDGFDLICSSLAMQWFDDQEGALGRMLDALAPGGHCVFTTLAEQTFCEWRAAHSAEGLEAGTRAFAAVGSLAAMHPTARVSPPLVERHVERHADAIGFLRALKAIGAETPASEHRVLTLPEMRRVMARFEADGAAVTYEVATCHYRKVDPA